MNKKDIHEFLGNEPSAWFGNADTLLKCAALIYPARKNNPHSIWVALMLRGYAVENLLKALWAGRGHKFSEDGRFHRPKMANQGGQVQDHNLVAISRSLERKNSKLRDNMLHALSRSIKHLGRYPIPIRPDQFAVHTKDKPDMKSIWCTKYEEEYWQLIIDLGSDLEFLKKLPDGFLSQVMESSWRKPWCSASNGE